MSFADSLFGRPLATSDERAAHIRAAAGVEHLLPIVITVLCLLVIVFFSYRQTIAAYPNGGGSYTVASENLGTGAGLLAAAALLIDYILTVAVGISAGVGAFISA